MKDSDTKKPPLSEIYGSHSFSERVMAERLPKGVYLEVKAAQAGEKEMDLQTAEVVANAMKDWALELGATHYTHWFQPLTGRTAEKHDSFISPRGDGGVIMEFSGRELIKGESDASSFPSGGLRATFEARGYTAWDMTSPAFLKEDAAGVTLHIPTAFVSYNGEALDKKVPLLRSMEAVNRQALRVLRAMGQGGALRVTPTVGAEQEYFLVEQGLFERRLDLRMTRRTLFGSLPPKGQELEDHYYGPIPDKVARLMKELNRELWKLGVAAKTQHKEVAPNQYEIACVYAGANVAADSNQLVMETLHKVAERHGMVALLHEKPYAGVNGSGKHDNWSLATDEGINLLDPGESPMGNARFLLFLVAVVKAVDDYAGALRASVASAGNDLRLGANEAPPAIVSVSLGELLESLLDRLAAGEKVEGAGGELLEIGHTRLPRLPKDLSDRNRTSPFAFTGNKFEFRMVPSGDSISSPTAILTAAVADTLSLFADRLEKAPDPLVVLDRIVVEEWKAHRRVVFSGNGYSAEWLEEAARRGLKNLPSTPDALPELVAPETVAMLERQHVLSRAELEARYHIDLEHYAKRLNIEAATMVEMARRQILPAGERWLERKAGAIAASSAARLPMPRLEAEAKACAGLVERIAGLADALDAASQAARSSCPEGDAALERARRYRTEILPLMDELRQAADALERRMPAEDWPFPGYGELLFRL